MNENNIEAQKDDDKSQLNNIEFSSNEKDAGHVILPQTDALKFDDRFKNRKSRRAFVKLINSSRVEKKKILKVNPNTGKRSLKTFTIVNKSEPKLNWSFMPKFTKQMSEQYSNACGIVYGWRNTDKLGLIRKASGETIAL